MSIARFQALPAVTRGMLHVLLATICFAVMQTAIRYVATLPGSEIHPVEVAFFRSLLGLIVLAPLFLRSGLSPLRTARLGLHFLRALFQAVGMLCFFVALTLIPISEVTALSFSAPLFATILALVVLRERVPFRRFAALGVGTLGVLVVLRPDAQVISAGAIFTLVSSIAWALAMTVIKVLTRTESAVNMTVYASLFLSAITLVPALFHWTWPTPYQFAWLVFLSICGTIGHISFAHAFKIADMSAVLPLDFTRLLWTSLLGYLVFAEVPTIWSWLGGALIFTAATYLAVRESTKGAAGEQARFVAVADDAEGSPATGRSMADSAAVSKGANDRR